MYRLLNPLAWVSLRSKWAAGKARGGRISEWIRNRRATQPPGPFSTQPSGPCPVAVFPRCSLLTYQSIYARRSRLEKQPTGLRRNSRGLGDATLDNTSTAASKPRCYTGGECKNTLRITECRQLDPSTSKLIQKWNPRSCWIKFSLWYRNRSRSASVAKPTLTHFPAFHSASV